MSVHELRLSFWRSLVRFTKGVRDDPPRHARTGLLLFIPAGAIHAAKNVGTGNAAELATYVVKKGQPLVAVAKH